MTRKLQDKVALITGGTSGIGLATAQLFIALERVAQPEEIARVALFLASEGSSFVTGQELSADGGFTTLAP